MQDLQNASCSSLHCVWTVFRLDGPPLHPYQQLFRMGQLQVFLQVHLLRQHNRHTLPLDEHSLYFQVSLEPERVPDEWEVFKDQPAGDRSAVLLPGNHAGLLHAHFLLRPRHEQTVQGAEPARALQERPRLHLRPWLRQQLAACIRKGQR